MIDVLYSFFMSDNKQFIVKLVRYPKYQLEDLGSYKGPHEAQTAFEKEIGELSYKHIVPDVFNQLFVENREQEVHRDDPVIDLLKDYDAHFLKMCNDIGGDHTYRQQIRFFYEQLHERGASIGLWPSDRSEQP